MSSRRQLLSPPSSAAVAGLPRQVTDSETDRWAWVRRRYSIDDRLIYLNTGN